MVQKEKHPNSHEVTIRRLAPFNHDSQEDANEWFKDANRSLGGAFKNGNSMKILTGLEPWEEKILLPGILSMDATDKEFRKEVDKFYNNINTKIPHDGLTLEIGMEQTNGKGLITSNRDAEVTTYQNPLNTDDYLKYRHAIAHPQVAPTEAQKHDITKSYYVEDLAINKKKAQETTDLKDEASLKYLEVKKTPNDVAMHLSLLGVDYRSIEKDDRNTKLKETVDKKPQEFIDNCNDEYAKDKFYIQRLVTAELIVKEGSRYLLEGQELGATMMDFVLYIRDDNNTETVGLLKARLKELAKA